MSIVAADEPKIRKREGDHFRPSAKKHSFNKDLGVSESCERMVVKVDYEVSDA